MRIGECGMAMGEGGMRIADWGVRISDCGLGIGMLPPGGERELLRTAKVVLK
jgi:hypothetical protein